MRFMLIDDHPFFREAVANCLRAAFPGCEVIETDSIAAACAEAGGGEFDLVFTELAMPGVTGFEGLLAIREGLPEARVAVLSGLDDPNTMRAALRLGASGFVSKRSGKAVFGAAVKTMLDGAVYVPMAVRRLPSRPLTDAPSREADVVARIRTLTGAQLKVLTCVKNGMVNKQIAHELNVGLSTVKAHVSAIIQKLGVATRTQIVIELQAINFSEFASAAQDVGRPFESGSPSATRAAWPSGRKPASPDPHPQRLMRSGRSASVSRPSAPRAEAR